MLATYSIDLHDKQVDYLKEVVKEHQINDLGKAIRCLVNFSIESEDLKKIIFDEERCINC